MKRLLLVPLVVSSCQTPREVTMPNGASYKDGGHFAGDTTVLMEPDGAVILRNKMNKPWADFLQAAAFVFGVDRAADVAVAQIAKQRAVARGAQQASIMRARDAGRLEELRLLQDFEKFKILNPVPTPLPAGPP